MIKRSIPKDRMSIIAFIFALSLTGAGCGGGSGGGGSDSNPPANRAPVVAQSFDKVKSLEDLDNYVNNVNAHFSDPDGDSLTLSVEGYSDVNVVLNGDTIIVSQATPGFYGPETGSVEACDPSGECVTAPLEAEVVQNTWPGIGSITVLQAQEDQIFYGQVNADDPDVSLGDSITYQLLDNSNFSELRIDPVTGELFTDNPLDFNSAGDHDVQIGVIDSFGGEFSDWYTLTVADKNRGPVIDDVTFSSAPTEGQPLSGTIYHHDDDGDPTECYLISSTLPEFKVTPTCSIYSCNSGNTCYNSDTGAVLADPLPQGSAGDHETEVGLTDGIEDDTYIKQFHVTNTWGANELPYQFDGTQYSEPPDVTTGIGLTAWENTYALNPDVRALFDNDEWNDMDLTMTRLNDSNAANWEWDGTSNVVTLNTDTIFYKIKNPDAGQTEWRGEYLGEDGVNLILSK